MLNFCNPIRRFVILKNSKAFFFTTIICFVFSLKRIQEQLRYVFNLTTNKKKKKKNYRSLSFFFKVIFDILEMVEYDIEQVFQETYLTKKLN